LTTIIISELNTAFTPWYRVSGLTTAAYWFAVSGILAFLSGIFALFYARFAPVVIGLFAFGAFALLLYTWPLKYYALGELFIFLIWGPIMITGVYVVLARLDTQCLGM